MKGFCNDGSGSSTSVDCGSAAKATGMRTSRLECPLVLPPGSQESLLAGAIADIGADCRERQHMVIETTKRIPWQYRLRALSV